VKPTTKAPTNAPVRALVRGKYSFADTSACSVNGPALTEATLLMKFVAFGDTPYDGNTNQLFEGSEFACLQNTMLPAIRNTLADKADFVLHVGDIKQGGATYSSGCTVDVFQSRKDLFSSVEPLIDFFLLVGDNEWNEVNMVVRTDLLNSSDVL
jgi:hypothetical protein